MPSAARRISDRGRNHRKRRIAPELTPVRREAEEASPLIFGPAVADKGMVMMNTLEVILFIDLPIVLAGAALRCHYLGK